MGITNTVKNLVSGNSENHGPGPGESTSASRSRGKNGSRKHKLPPGTGPGTSGKPAAEPVMGERAYEQGQVASGTSGDVGRERLASQGSDRSSASSGFIEEMHQHGHSTYNPRDLMPSGVTQEDTNQLNPVTHERIHFLETEEVQRVKDRHRHIYHIQHHIQPVTVSEHMAEKFVDNTYPITTVRELRTNKEADNALFQGQVRQHQDTLTQLDKQRTIVDKGVTVNEHVHHHVHHVIQPIIKKETFDRQRIRTVIPIQEDTHEAPIVHQSQTHPAVSIEHFRERGGILQDAIPAENIAARVLHIGQGTREVEGVADSLARELKLGETMREPVTTKTIPSQAQTYPQRDEMHEMPRPRVETETDAPVTMPMASIN